MLKLLKLVSLFIRNFLLSSGAGQEVGRSCHVLKFKGKKIMVS